MSEQTILKNKAYYLFEGFTNLRVVCAFSGRSLGNMSLFYGDAKNSLENRNNFLEELDINYKDLVCARQVHKASVRYVEETDRGKGALNYDTAIADTDALITDKSRVPLAIFTADCLSIFLYDPTTMSIGLIHGGRRSIQEGIVAKTLQLMKEKFNIRVQDLYVGLGPSIRDCCYEVGEEFNDFFPGGLIKRDNRYYLDLIKINKIQLREMGAKDINIFDSGICTSCENKKFFSYRREGRNSGRMMSVIMLK